MTIGSRAVALVAHIRATVRTKLLFAFLCIVVMQIVLGTLGLRVLSDINERNEELIALQSKIAVYGNVQHDTTRQLYRVSTALLSEDREGLDTLLRQLNQFGFSLDRLQLVERDEADLMARLRSEYEDFIGLVSETVRMTRDGELEVARRLQTNEVHQFANRLERLTNQLINTATANMLDRIEASERAYEASRTAVVAVALVSVALALCLGYIFSSSVLVPLAIIRRRLSEVAQGEFNREITVPNRDEMGELAADLNRTSERLDLLYRQIAEQKAQMEEVSTKISRYIPHQLYRSIFSGDMDTMIATRRRHLTVFFSDIRDFSARTETLEPEALAEILNAYFSTMAEIAQAHGATIDKFIGDAILAFFGDPDTEGAEKDAQRCIEMALEMQSRMTNLSHSFVKLGLFKPLQIRIGINSGHCTVGNFGSSERIDYTIIGSPVNVAARLQDACPPDAVLVSRSTRMLADGRFDFDHFAVLELKGVSQPVEAFTAMRKTSERVGQN